MLNSDDTFYIYIYIYIYTSGISNWNSNELIDVWRDCRYKNKKTTK